MIFLSLDFPRHELRIVIYLDDSPLLGIIVPEYALGKLDVTPGCLDDATLDRTIVVIFGREVSEIRVLQAEDTPSL